VATSLVALRRWGMSARFCGVICADPFGTEILAGLKQEGVNVDSVVLRDRGRSQFAFICVEPHNANRTIFWRRPEAEPLLSSEIPEAFLKDAAALHLDGLFAEASLHAAIQARVMGIPVILDAGSVRPGTVSLIPHTDHLICAENFARQFDPGASLVAVLRKLKEMGPRMVSITLGEKGSVSLWKEDPCHLPALAVQAKDTTGAGDIFHAGYIYGLLCGWAPEDRIRWATAAAGLSCLELGGRSGIPAPGAVQERLAELGVFRSVSPSAEGFDLSGDRQD